MMAATSGMPGKISEMKQVVRTPASWNASLTASRRYVICRGSAKQIIFEDDDDRAFFMERLSSLLSVHGGMLVCWCLMDNHVHLVIRADLGALSALMHALLTSYSGYFNRVHQRTGPSLKGVSRARP